MLTAVIGVLVLAGAAFGATQLLGGERRSRRARTRVQPAAPDDEPAATATAAPAVTKEDG